MRLNQVSARFDLSDVNVDPPVDNLDAVLDIAGEVLAEYAPDHGNTRIERMARWLALNVGAEVPVSHAGDVSYFQPERVRVMRVGEKIAIDTAGRRTFSPDEARTIVVAFLRAIELAESAEG